MVNLGELVPSTHIYRKFASIWDFNRIQIQLKSVEKENNYKGYGITRLFKCLLLQFLEDLSDRGLERYLQENNAGKWFCGFELTEATPDHTVFSRIRDKIGANKLSKLFSNLRDQLRVRSKGYMNEVFNFVDASQLIAKASLWQE
jgi:transposase, IS5 family